MSREKFNSKAQLKRFKKQFILGGIGLLLIILILAFMSSPAKEEQTQTSVKLTASDTFSAAKPLSTSPPDIMAQRLNQFTLDQQKINQQNAQRIAELESQNLAYLKSAQDAESNAAIINQKLSTLNTVKVNTSSPIIKPQKLVFEDDINNDTPDSSFEATTQKIASQANNTNSNEDKSVTTYIPSNTFVKGILIGSLSANTGGNASSQTSALVIQGIASGELDEEHAGSFLKRELLIALAIGFGLSLIAFLRTYFFSGLLLESTVVACSLGIVVIFSMMCGAVIPFVLYRLRMDPAHSAGPLLATCMDIIGVVVFCLISRAFLS